MIIGYARVSTATQNVDGQVAALHAAGCQRVTTETASGKHGAARPEFDELRRNLRPGDTLVVTELSRLGRHTADLATLADGLQSDGIGLRILNLGIDTNTPAGRLIFTVIAAVAQMERELLIERTQRGLQAARAHGHVGGRPRKLSARQVTVARTLRDAGELTMAEIAAQLGVGRRTLYRALSLPGAA